jgi:hypothetical protein
MKKWYLSKTLWINFISMAAISLQVLKGREIIPLQDQTTILAVVNIFMRFITKEGLE